MRGEVEKSSSLSLLQAIKLDRFFFFLFLNLMFLPTMWSWQRLSKHSEALTLLQHVQHRLTLDTHRKRNSGRISKNKDLVGLFLHISFHFLPVPLTSGKPSSGGGSYWSQLNAAWFFLPLPISALSLSALLDSLWILFHSHFIGCMFWVLRTLMKFLLASYTGKDVEV